MKDYGGTDRNSPETCARPHARAGAHALKAAATYRAPTKETAPGRNCSLWTRIQKGAGFMTGAASCWAHKLE